MSEIPTPALVVDLAVMRRNLARLAAYAQAHGLNLRPHTKTHKSLRFAHMQLEQGAGGLTVAKVGEAEVMAGACSDILIAYPIVDPSRSARVAQLAKTMQARVALDSVQAADAIGAVIQNAGYPGAPGALQVGILVDVDVGFGRTGVQSPEDALKLAQHVSNTAGLRLDGIMCYPGHVREPVDRQGEQLARVADKLAHVIDLWRRHGLDATIVSGGSTPTAYQSHLIPQLTEIRPGTYIFNDMNTVHGGYCTLDDCAAWVECTVVSDAVPGQIVIDAGSKTLTSDQCLWAPDSGHGCVREYPDAIITRLSEEHGQMDVRRCAKRPRIGERVRVIPNHICPCANLQDWMWLQHADGDFQRIAVDARGRLS